MRIQIRRIGGALCFLVCVTAAAFGQLYTGSITGTVKDPTGAVVPNANVTITDVGKGFNYTATTDNGGIFTVKNLPPATYKERVEAPGFTPFERNNIVVEVNSNVEAS
ncbi:MAG: carboxypeptidase regulatory-like domain-containing protein, partial [Acidobacteriaceae bacterium]|nr:carboxypeptidase regulatory-like domain-containing protein [Acidobacteriaceae bacterium]